MPGYLKIGMTTKTPEERARELSASTGVAVPYSVAYSEEVVDCAMAESMIHNRLSKFRVNRGREFFHLSLRDAIRELSEIADAIGRVSPNQLDRSLVQNTVEIGETERLPKSNMIDDSFTQPAFDDRIHPTSFPATRTEQDLVNTLTPSLQRAYLEMRKRAMAFGPQVATHATRQNLIFKAGNVFAEIGPKRACLSVLVRPEGFNISENASAQVHGIIVKRVPDTHLWTVTHKFDVDDRTPMDSVEKLLRQSFNAVLASGASRSHRTN